MLAAKSIALSMFIILFKDSAHPIITASMTGCALIEMFTVFTVRAALRQ